MNDFNDKFIEILNLLVPTLGNSSYSLETFRFIMNYADERGLNYSFNSGNLVVTIPDNESPDEAPVVLQSHIDINKKVKQRPLSYNLEENKLEIKLKRPDFPFGIVFMLMLCDSYKSFRHPKLYLIFTRDKHNNFDGAEHFDVSILEDVEYFINLNNTNDQSVQTDALGIREFRCSYTNFDKRMQSGTEWFLTFSNFNYKTEKEKLLNGAAQVMYHLSLMDNISLKSLNYKNNAYEVEFLTPPENNLFTDYAYCCHLVEDTFNNDIESTYMNGTFQRELAYSSSDTESLLWDLLFFPNNKYYNNKNQLIGYSEITDINNRADKDDLLFMVKGYFNNEEMDSLLLMNISQFVIKTKCKSSSVIVCPALKQPENFQLFEIYKNLARSNFNLKVKKTVAPQPLELNIFSYFLPDLQLISIGPNIKYKRKKIVLDLESARTIYELLIELLKYLSPEEEIEKTIIERTNGEIVEVKELFEKRSTDEDLDS